jgi:outer membrane protein
MHIQKTTLAAVLVATAGLAQAQGHTPHIGVIDMERVAAESKTGKSYTARIQALQDAVEKTRTQKQADLQKMDAAIKALQDEVDKDAQLAPDVRDKKQAEIKRKTREREGYLDDGRAELQKMQEKAQGQANAWNDELRSRARPIMEQVAKQEGIDILVDGRAAVVLNNAFDISDKVIAALDAQAPAADTATTQKPAAAAKPAVPPRPTKK